MYFYVIIYKIWKQWKLSPHPLSSFFYGGKFASTTLSQPICHGLDLISSQGLWSYHFHASESWVVHFSFSTESFTPTYTNPPTFPDPTSPHATILFSMFTVSTSSSPYPTPKGLLFLPFTLAAVSKVTKACFPVIHCHGYLLSFSYSIPRQQSTLWSRLTISFFWGCLFSFYACGSTLSWLSPPSRAPCKQFYKLFFLCYTSKVQSVLGLGLSYLKSYFELGFPDISIKNTGCLLKFEFYVTFFKDRKSVV